MNSLLEWIIFLALSGITVVTAAGMLLTMSMYRAGLALMASFVALAGLFILLDADLLAAIQIMMNVGGMLVMVLFMVMIMMDPGGEMMWEMKRDMHIPGPGAFSMHMPWGKSPEEQPAEHQEGSTGTSDWTCPMHPEVSQAGPGNCPKCGMALIPRAEMSNGDSAQDIAASAQVYTCPMHPDVRQDHPGTCPKCGMALIEDASPSRESHEHQDLPTTHNTHMEQAGDSSINAAPVMSMKMDSSGNNGSDQDTHMSHDDMQMPAMTPRQHYHMMVDMAMSTSQLPWAIALGVASALLLVILFIKTPWPLSHGVPTQDATTMVGELLLSRYMIGFEGAAFLILAGIAGAVILARRERTPAQPPQARQGEPAATETGQQAYTCPMHPDVRQRQPGNCPKCGMSLIPVEGTPVVGKLGGQGTHTHEHGGDV
jgi:NADH:ubiquinone oxidoreductase subunit 6 (subunit J)/predicted RNA-binding Zn-ribbon protein involved in translation (DUF1610 family)